MQVREPAQATPIEYPASDGEPVAETDTHIQLMFNLRFAVKDFFRDEPDVYVGNNLFIYYVEGEPGRRVAPDLFVVRGVSKGDRRSYKLWEEGRPPDVVIELSSRQTWREDLQTKYRLYEQLGVKEYFIFDPEYDYLPEPIAAWRLEDNQYVPLEVTGGRVRSEALGLELVDTGETLRLLNPETGQFLPTALEAAEAHRQAEAEVARLREELARLREDPSS
jgi:Uma2 family endonuclease